MIIDYFIVSPKSEKNFVEQIIKTETLTMHSVLYKLGLRKDSIEIIENAYTYKLNTETNKITVTVPDSVLKLPDMYFYLFLPQGGKPSISERITSKKSVIFLGDLYEGEKYKFMIKRRDEAMPMYRATFIYNFKPIEEGE